MSVLINDEMKAAVWKLIEAELERTKDRPFPPDPLRRAGIVLEEAAEVHKEAMEMGRTWRPDHISRYHQLRSNMLIEAVHTAASAVNLLVHMIKEDNKVE